MYQVKIEEVAANIRGLREAAGLSQEEVAAALGMDTELYAAKEDARAYFWEEDAIKLCKLFRCGPEDIFHKPETK